MSNFSVTNFIGALWKLCKGKENIDVRSLFTRKKNDFVKITIFRRQFLFGYSYYKIVIVTIK